MAKESDYKGYNKMKRVYPLQEWDVSFSINGDVLSRFLTFIEDIHPDLPLIFYKNKIVIRQRSSDNISFVNISIDIIDAMNYDPGLGEDATENDRKLVIIGSSGLADEIAGFSKGADMLTVRIDTKKLKKCEFTCGEYRKHKIMLVPPDDFMKLEITEKKIRANRDNPATKGCDMIIEPETFAKVCALGGKKGGSEMIFEVSKKGLLVYTSDEDSGSSFEILNDQNPYETGNIGNVGNMEDVGKDFEYSDEDEDNDGIDSSYDSSIDNSEVDNTNNSEAVNTNNSEVDRQRSSEARELCEATVDEWNMPIPHTDRDPGTDSNENRKSGKKKEKSKDKPKEKEEEKKTNAIVSRTKFILFTMTEKRETISVIEKKEYISVIMKLKAQSPILMELRHNAPLIIEQNSPGMWRATLTIAPIVPDENGN